MTFRGGYTGHPDARLHRETSPKESIFQRTKTDWLEIMAGFSVGIPNSSIFAETPLFGNWKHEHLAIHDWKSQGLHIP